MTLHSFTYPLFRPDVWQLSMLCEPSFLLHYIISYSTEWWWCKEEVEKDGLLLLDMQSNQSTHRELGDEKDEEWLEEESRIIIWIRKDQEASPSPSPSGNSFKVNFNQRHHHRHDSGETFSWDNTGCLRIIRWWWRSLSHFLTNCLLIAHFFFPEGGSMTMYANKASDLNLWKEKDFSCQIPFFYAAFSC